MAATAPNILMLPLELFRAVLAELMLARGVKRALRLRLVNGFFANEVIRMLHHLRLLDDCERRTCSMGSIGADYITQRLLYTSLPVHREWSQIPSIAARLALEDDEHQENYIQYVKILCHRAAEIDDPPLATLCAKEGYPPSEPHYNYNYNLMAAAAYMNKCSVIEELVGQPVNLNQSMGLFGHPEVCAAVAGHDSALKLLTEKFPRNGDFYLLSCVSRHAPTRMVEAFVPEISPAIFTINKRYCEEEFARAFWTPNVETFKVLLRVKAKWTPDEETSRKFMRAKVELPKPEIEKRILACLLEDAASLGWEDVIRYILTIGAPVDGTRWSDSPLTRACMGGFERIIGILLEHGAKLQDNDLAVAAKGGHLNVVKILMEFGADPNQGNPRPIISAISRERKDMFQELLDHGASLVGQNGVEAVQKAREEGLDSMLALLEEHGVDVQKLKGILV